MLIRPLAPAHSLVHRPAHTSSSSSDPPSRLACLCRSSHITTHTGTLAGLFDEVSSWFSRQAEASSRTATSFSFFSTSAQPAADTKQPAQQQPQQGSAGPMAPTSNQRKAAEALKAEGNALFSKGRYLPAAERYTEAITLIPKDPGFVTLYVNRAMCYKKVERWQAVVDDAATALSLDSSSMKAHYLLGIGLREQQQLSRGISHLQRALEAAREKGDSIKDEIWRELAKTKYAAWQQDSKRRVAVADTLKQQIDGLLQTCQWHAGSLPPELFSGNGSMQAEGAGLQDKQHSWQELVQQQWGALFDRAAHLDKPGEVPSHLLCPLTMEVFRDPVISPSGFSYERSALLEHLTRVGKFDPISRSPMTESDVTPNVALRNATQHFLDEHPWAWQECI